MKLYRSRRDSKLFGVCGGLAESMNVDPTLLRLVVVITTFFSAGATIPLYFIAALVIPKEPTFGDPGYGAPPRGTAYGGFNGVPPHGTPYRGTEPYGTAYRGAEPHGNHYGGTYGAAGVSGGYGAGPSNVRPTASSAGQPGNDHLDEMMKDIEKKALLKEIEELRAKLAKYENKYEKKGDE